MPRILLSLAFVIAAASAFSQRISNVRLYPVSGSSVNIRFTVLPGIECSGYRILHGTDSLGLVEAYHYPAVCGMQGVPMDHSYTHDRAVRNTVNYYSIQIPGETSPPARIFVAEGNATTVLPYPNPVYNYATPLKLRIWNTNNQRMQGMLLNQYGIAMRDLDLVTESETATIDIESLENGLYIVWLTDGQNLFRTKFIIHRQ